MLIEMKVTGLTIDPFTNMPIIILKDLEEKSALPIWIGLIEASAIATELEKIQLARPMTHDLMRNVLQTLEVKVEKVEVNDLCDNTFYARIYLKNNGREFVIDSRPSDAIALALRVSAPIFVDKKVIEKSRNIDLGKENKEGKKGEREKWAEILENLTPEDFGKYKM
jgi:bifunctional DNase/RNase